MEKLKGETNWHLCKLVEEGVSGCCKTSTSATMSCDPRPSDDVIPPVNTAACLAVCLLPAAWPRVPIPPVTSTPISSNTSQLTRFILETTGHGKKSDLSQIHVCIS